MQVLAKTLLAAARATPRRKALQFVASNGDSKDLYFGAMIDQVELVSEFLRQKTSSGSAVLLVFPPGLEFLPAFLGCLFGNVIAVPVAAPVHSEDRERIMRIARDCKCAVGLTVRGLISKLDVGGADFADSTSQPRICEWLSIEDILDGAASGTTTPAIPSKCHCSQRSNDVAYIQYSSGSTSNPRGIEVTPQSLLHNLHCIADALSIGPDDNCVTWLPHFHDMGLVGTLLAPLFVGAASVILSPRDFVRSPISWLQAISKFRGTFTASPNFGYELCLKHMARGETLHLDLTGWRAAANGSEPVQAETMRRFTKTFACMGFDSLAMAPCYGLAEATLVVSMSRPRSPVSYLTLDRRSLSEGIIQESSGEGAVTLVGCGPPVAETVIAIVDPVSLTRKSQSVGEIWVQSESVAKGYHDRRSDSDRFAARIKNEKGLFLRTGDLGFMHNGELFVTGRIKDVIIVRGRNILAQDIEGTMQDAHPGLRANRGVAFSYDWQGEEGLVILQEIKSKSNKLHMEEVIATIRAVINRVHGIDPLEITLLPRRTIALTSSGKLARWQNKSAWERNEMPALARWSRIVEADKP
jgi:acyl-CoA synthetase (AMP-forming)/AMP-acid ligase II